MRISDWSSDVCSSDLPIPVDTRRGEQFKPEYLALNPNAKAPSLVDGDVTVFDSNAILLYLAEKTGRLMPEDTAAARGAMLSRSEEHTSELQSHMRISHAAFFLIKKTTTFITQTTHQ